MTPHLSKVVLSVLLAMISCRKAAEVASPTVEAGPQAIELHYKLDVFKLRTDATFSFKTSSPQGASEASGEVVGLLDVTRVDGKLKVGQSVVEVRDLNLDKEMLPPTKEGATSLDPKDALRNYTGAFVVNAQGEMDEEATKALAETAEAKKKEGLDALVGNLVAGVLGLPKLTQAPLVEGKTVEINERKDHNFQGLVIPIDITHKYTLVKIDSSSGKHIAEIKQTTESSGALEQEGEVLSLEVLAEGVVLFNLEDQLPVQSTSSSTTNISVGKMSLEIISNANLSYAPV